MGLSGGIRLLSSIAKNAYQAMAIDENRKDYDVCFLSQPLHGFL